MRVLLGEVSSWDQAACTPTQAQDPRQSLNRGSFSLLHQQYYAKQWVQKSRFPSYSITMDGRSSIFRRGWWRLLGDDLLLEDSAPNQSTETQKRGLLLCFRLRRGQDGYIIRPQAASPAIILQAVLYHSDLGWGLVQNTLKWNRKSFPLAKRSYKLYALTSPEMGGRELAKACFFFFFGGIPRQFGIISHIKAAAQFTLFWFRRRCFLLSFFLEVGEKEEALKSRIKIQWVSKASGSRTEI